MSGWSAEDAETFAVVSGEELDRSSPCTWPPVEGRRRCDDCPICGASDEPCSVGDLIHALFTPPPSHRNIGGWASGAVPHREGWAR